MSASAKDQELLEEYVPKSLRLPKVKRRLQYSIAGQSAWHVESYAGLHGPTPDLQDMLDTVPIGVGVMPVFLFRHNTDDTDEKLYVWIDVLDPPRWVRVHDR